LTLGELHERIERRLRAARLRYGHGAHDARQEAAYLVFGGLGMPFDEPLERPVGASQARRVERLAHRRIVERIPAAYLVRKAWLGDLEFYVDRRVIVPRSFIAELLRERLRPWLQRPLRRALDLCTGSGCLAIAAAREFPKAHVDAADISPAALTVARINVSRYQLQRRIRLVRSDLFEALRDSRYDLIVSNPPYVTAASMRRLPAEYRYEPDIALAGGPDGLELVRRIIREAAAHLEPRGVLVCEIGHNRRALERTFPHLPLIWPETSAGSGHVFILHREALPALPHARTAGRARVRPRPARGG
jgi:ribosomal protein L3 glutamine methyltransferase